MVSANHLLMVFLAVEMASVPSYALVALMKRRCQASEAALKYAVYGAATAGVMLYGISLLPGWSIRPTCRRSPANWPSGCPTCRATRRWC